MSEDNKTPKRGGGGGMGGGPMGGSMGRPAEKAKNFKATLKRLLGYLRPQMVKFVIVFILAIGSTIFSIVGPKIMGKATTKIGEALIAKITYIVKLQMAINQHMPQSTINALRNQIIPQYDVGYVGKILLLMIGLYAVSSLLQFISAYVMSGVAQTIVFSMRNDVKAKLDKLPLKYFDARTHGEVLSRVTNDMDNIATTLQQSMTQLITSLVTIIGIVAMMLSISPVMTLIAFVTLPLSGVITMFIAKKSQKYYAGQQKSIGELNGHVEEMYTGHKAVKVFGHEEDSLKEFRRINGDLYSVGWKAQFMSGIIFPALNFVSNLGYVFVCIIGGLLVAKKKVEIGDIQAFIQYMRSFSQPIMQTANIANVIQSTIASAERVFEILDEQEEVHDVENPITLERAEGNVEFRNVEFGYKPDVTLIKNMNITVEKGKTIAIVGPTGAGKTTIVNLLMRFYEINSGEILIDGINITKIPRSDLRKLFGMVLQDTWLFNGTIYDNIKYGNENATEEDVMRASKAAHAHHFIKSLPEKYETKLNEEASNISQGQKQLLTIARAILANPSILILDEATSNVDTRTEVYIQKAMDALMADRTSFVIAHRLSTIKNADVILVMSQGSIIEQGNHQALIEKGGFYADLYNSQFAED